MSARRRPADREPGDQFRSIDRPDDADDVQPVTEGRGRGPQGVEPWGTTGGTQDRDAPWGASEDSPLDEGSEETGLPPARRGERRAGQGEPRPWAPASGQHGFGSVEPTRVPEAGPGGTPSDPGARRPRFPDDTGLDDLRNNPLEEQTGMRSEGVRRRE